MVTPTLVVVSGPAGSGKTTLARALAQAVGCPMISRDEIKEGMVLALGGEYEAIPADSLTVRASSAFFQIGTPSLRTSCVAKSISSAPARKEGVRLTGSGIVSRRSSALTRAKSSRWSKGLVT